ncbi:MAG: tetratricopeptide repeat protein [Gemmatimonadaceae bacterium]
MRCSLLLLMKLGVVVAAPLAAQDRVARADALLRAGRLSAAESEYYAAVRLAPRDPSARLALGKYLAARGALKVGAVLMEEARFFGGDPKTVAEHLAPVYGRLGAYDSLLTLPSSPLSATERARARWLRDNPTVVAGPETATLRYRPSEAGTLGRVTLTIGGDSVEATIDPRAEGLTLDTAWARRRSITSFAAEGERNTRRRIGVATVDFGALTVRNAPVRFAPQRGARRAVVGIDVLGALAPTFDPRAGALTLRRSGKVEESLQGVRAATLLLPDGLWMVRGRSIVALGSPDSHLVLRDSRWTYNARRGEIIVAK